MVALSSSGGYLSQDLLDISAFVDGTCGGGYLSQEVQVLRGGGAKTAKRCVAEGYDLDEEGGSWGEADAIVVMFLFVAFRC